MDLAGRVVVLSGCRSSSGVLLAGEGVLSLARAFLAAGAQTVVGSLWPLRDDDAQRMMSLFYRHLSRGSSVRQAMAYSRRDEIRAGLPAAAWSGLVVIGNADVALEPGPKQGVPGALTGAVAALLCLGLFLLGRRVQRAPRASDGADSDRR
jgi:hypothetical protein